MSAPLRIAFFGLPLAALLLAEDGHHVALAAIARSDAPGRRRLARRIGQESVLLKPNVRDPALAERVRALAPDLLVSWFWTTRLPMGLVRAARLGGLGAHPSLLPRHRGPDPTYWAIRSGDAQTGVTVHELAAEYDTGAILAARSLPIAPTWNAWQLAKALDRPSLALLREVVGRLARGEAVPRSPQNEALATAAPSPSDEECAIQWAWPAEEVLRHVRALAPAPGAWTEVDGAMVAITHAELAPKVPRALAVGEGAVLGGRAVVRAGEGGVTLLAGEIDGEPADGAALAALFRARGG
jgi:methionyl-tRNA formyltransferase